jgi:aryl-alcohol dehydrogenase-like predicted oxidoreductase
MAAQQGHHALVLLCPSPGPLGPEGLALCFGGNVFGWTADERTSFSLLDAWLDAGFNFIDTADVYSRWAPGHTGGESETVIGKWLQAGGRRDKVVIATKVGMDMGEGRIGLKPSTSARRWRRRCAPADRLHRPVPGAQGRRGHAAGSDAGSLRQADRGRQGAGDRRLQLQRRAPAQALETSKRLGLPRYETLQPLYNLYDRAEFEQRAAAAVPAREVGVINFYALAAGFLTGKYRSPEDAAKSPRGAGTVKKYLNERGLRSWRRSTRCASAPAARRARSPSPG